MHMCKEIDGIFKRNLIHWVLGDGYQAISGLAESEVDHDPYQAQNALAGRFEWGRLPCKLGLYRANVMEKGKADKGAHLGHSKANGVLSHNS